MSFFRSKENVVRAVNLYITNRCERHMSAAFARIQWLHFVAEHFDILCTWTPTNSTTLLALLQKMQQWLLLTLHNLILTKVQKLLGDQEVTVATHWFVMMGEKNQLPGQCISLSNICVNGGGITYFIGKEGVISCGVGSSGISFRWSLRSGAEWEVGS